MSIRGSLGARCGTALVTALFVAVYVALLAWSAIRHSQTSNEIGHVPAAICHWRYGMFELYRVNPPLPRMVAIFPLLCMDVQTDWTNYELRAFSREEVRMGIRFARANGPRTFWLFTVARWACIPFCLLGAWVCYRWAVDLWSISSGLTALGLWSFSPIILGNGPLVMPDVPAAAMGTTSAYLFWRWLRKPIWLDAALAGIALGGAALSKTTLLLFFFLWPVLCLVYGWSRQPGLFAVPWPRRVAMVGAMLLVALYIINLGYGFSGSFKPLEAFQFRSRLLNGRQGDGATAGNRFAGTWFGRLPVPVPADYLQGIDRQRADFEEGDRSYLRGEWKQGGWWYYHLYALAIKTPLGTWCVLLTAVILTVCSRFHRASVGDEACQLLPAVVILALVSSQTGFSNHMRYTIPALPFLFIWMSKAASHLSSRHRGLAMTTACGLSATMVSGLAIYPHDLSYFNVLAGGPARGHEHLLDSSIAWGQDLLFLRRWLDEHPQARPLHLAAFGWIDPRLAGIEFTLPPVGPDRPGVVELEGSDASHDGPRPGWYAIDVNFLHGTHWRAANADGGWRVIDPVGLNYRYFERFKPVHTVGYSTYIYHITLDEANRVRRDLCLAELP